MPSSVAPADVINRLRERTGPLTLAAERTLPVASGLQRLLPAGLRRGTTVTVSGDAAVSFTLALIGEATRTGSWLAVVGAPWLGWPAAAELGVALERTVTVADPGRERWAEVTGALLDGFDLVLAAPPEGQMLRPRDARRLADRARQRGAVLISLSMPGPADLQCRAVTSAWSGIGAGHGHLAGRRVTVELGGRRQPRTSRVELWLPGPAGEVAEVEPMASVTAIGA